MWSFFYITIAFSRNGFGRSYVHTAWLSLDWQTKNFPWVCSKLVLSLNTTHSNIRFSWVSKWVWAQLRENAWTQYGVNFFKDIGKYIHKLCESKKNTKRYCFKNKVTRGYTGTLKKCKCTRILSSMRKPKSVICINDLNQFQKIVVFCERRQR